MTKEELVLLEAVVEAARPLSGCREIDYLFGRTDKRCGGCLECKLTDALAALDAHRSTP